MTRSAQTSSVFQIISLALIFIGKPFYKLFVTLPLYLISIANSFSKTPHLPRFNRVKKKPVRKIPTFSLHIPKPALLIIPFIVFIIGVALLYKEATLFLQELPDVASLPTYKNYASSKVFDRNGKLLYKFYDDIDRTPVPLTQIPITIRLATIAAEDHDFYFHHGVSPKAIARALYDWWQGKGLTGASTITQQLVKNVYLTPERTVDRKVREMILALKVEQLYSKDKILELYLNRVPYGGTAYGIEEAARMYFNKDVKEITLSEAAFLASLPQNPSRDLVTETSVERRDDILLQMKELGYISDKEEATAKLEHLAFKREPLFTTAPHFIMYLRDLLARSYGEYAVIKGGLRVQTTIDPKVQALAEKAVQAELKKVASLHVNNAGVLVLSVKTGEVLAMVGSKDYNDFAHGGNVNTTLSSRQPGSSIKLINYAYALSHGFTPATVVEDTPISFKMQGASPYIPKNYDGTFKGRMTLRDAFAQSRNIPAVKVLASYGVAHMIDMGEAMGITSWGDRKRFGLSLTLGGGEVTLLDLATAYLTIANYGKRIPVYPIKELTTLKDTHLTPLCVRLDGCTMSDAVDARVAYQIIDILSDNRARTPAFGHRSALVVPNHPEVAVKTGTSNNLRDNLTVGFNQDYLVAVWVGNNDGSSMSRVASGVTGASPIWNSIMTELLRDKSSEPWSVPSGLVQLACGGGKKEWFLEGTAPKNRCGDPVAFSELPVIYNF